MKPFRTKIEFLLQTLVWYLDYTIYLLFSPYKFKKIPKTIKNILIIELIYIGDLIAITPTIKALKQKFPESNINLMTLKEMEPVLSGNPKISKIISYKKEDFQDKKKIINNLKNKYDLAIILHPNPKIGAKKISKIIKKAKIPFRIGCTKVGLREGKGKYLHRKTKPTIKLKHKIDDNLDVIKTLKIKPEEKKLELYTLKEIDKKIKNKLPKNKKKNLVIHPIPNHKTHEWIPRKFAEIADTLDKEFNIIFTGSKKDKSKIKKIKSLMKTKSIDLSGTSIKEFFSIIKLSDAVISVDTSAMHIAAAFDKPILALFGAGNPKIWKPYTEKAEIIYNNNKCTSCMKHKCFRKKPRYMECMNSITKSQVLNSFDKIKKYIN